MRIRESKMNFYKITEIITRKSEFEPKSLKSQSLNSEAVAFSGLIARRKHERARGKGIPDNDVIIQEPSGWDNYNTQVTQIQT